MNPQQHPMSDRLSLIEESAIQIEKAINAVPWEDAIKSDLIAVAFVPGVKDIPSIVGDVEGTGIELDLIPFADSGAEDLTRLIKLSAEKTPEALRRFLKQEQVQWAGPVVAMHERTFAYLTHELILQIDDGADTASALALASELGFEQLRRIPYATPATYHLRAKDDQHPGRGLLDHARRLMEIPGVLAEPNLAGIAEPDVANRPELSSELWDRKQIRTEAAWKLLSEAGKPGHQAQDVVLAVVDGSLGDGHPALRDYKRYDFRYFSDQVHHLFEGNALGHGMRVAGVAAANGEGDGVMGVAPDCSVIGLFYPATELDVVDMYLWAAGIDPESPRKNFPELPRRSADVVITSVRFGFSRRLPILRPTAAAFDLIAREGRGGKGSLLFFSAGNSNADTSVDNPWAAYESNFGIAASTLDGKRELRATYSNYRGVELCAPSSESLRHPRSGIKRGILSLALAGKGNRKRAGTTPSDATDNYTDAFGGTSSAAPLAAGVAALVLTARPELKHGDVREILRGTAIGIDTSAKGAKTVWRDEKGQPAKRRSDRIQSWGYGFGRVDAKAAVKEALVYRPSSGSKRSVSKSGRSRASSGAPGIASFSLVLGLYHLILCAALFWLWPGDATQCSDSKYLAWISLVLGLYHLVVWAVLEPLRRWFKDSPDDEDPDLMDPDPG